MWARIHGSSRFSTAMSSRPAARTGALGRPVLVEVAVAVEMVVGEVQEDADARPETLDPFELEARHLGDRRGEVAADRVDERRAEVAADERPRAGAAQHVAEQRRGRALAVGAGDGERAERRASAPRARSRSRSRSRAGRPRAAAVRRPRHPGSARPVRRRRAARDPRRRGARRVDRCRRRPPLPFGLDELGDPGRELRRRTPIGDAHAAPRASSWRATPCRCAPAR